MSSSAAAFTEPFQTRLTLTAFLKNVVNLRRNATIIFLNSLKLHMGTAFLI